MMGVSSRQSTAKGRIRRVLIVDDHPIVRLGLRRILEGELDLLVCGESETTNDTLAAIRTLEPDLLICEFELRDSAGIDLIRLARAHHPPLRILVLSAQDEALYAERMLSLGANGYVMKESSSEQFLASLRCVLDGQIYVSEAVRRNMLKKYAGRRSFKSADPVDRLSHRELQILDMIGKGMTTRESAAALNLSVKTVETHRQAIKRKLNLSTGMQLVRFAVLDLARRDAEGRENCSVE